MIALINLMMNIYHTQSAGSCVKNYKILILQKYDEN